MLGLKQAATRVSLHPRLYPSALTRFQLLQLQTLVPTGLRLSHTHTLQRNMDPEIDRITSFWYSKPLIDWFRTPEGLDAECDNQFGPLIRKARTNELDGWTETTNGTLALLILLDQFPRNVFRNTADAFSSDSKAFDVATQALAVERDKGTDLKQMMTLYLPLMHSESLIAQVACRALIETLVAGIPEDNEDAEMYKTGGLMASKGHLDVIRKFGRFPSRNKILGRESTPEEEAFLKENPSGFAGMKK